MMMTRSTLLAVLTFCGLALVGPGPVQALESFALYEDWRGADHMRGDRWNGFMDSMPEFRRAVQGHKLSMHLRSEGRTDSDAGTQLQHNRAFLATPTLVDQLQAEVKVQHVEVTGCAANPAPSVIRAVALTLNRFSDGPVPPVPGSLVGDYLARLQIIRASNSPDAAGVLRVQGRLFHCLDAGCVATTTVAAVDFPDAVALGQRVQLQLIWDAPNNQFLVGVDQGALQPLPYPAAANARTSVVPLADVRQSGVTASCTAGATVADGLAEIGRVFTNAAAVVP
ncbi:MAG TPA: hypothetical protein VL086_08130 [Candidatus Nitrosotalea sp.]|nr:hypothetical protein [Candidatus Nitrosotalea sp.]